MLPRVTWILAEMTFERATPVDPPTRFKKRGSYPNGIPKASVLHMAPDEKENLGSVGLNRLLNPQLILLTLL